MGKKISFFSRWNYFAFPFDLLPPLRTVRDGTRGITEQLLKEIKVSHVPFKKLASIGVASAVKRIATPQRVAKVVCAKLLKKIPMQTQERGVTVQIEKVFRKGEVLLLYFAKSAFLDLDCRISFGGWNI